VDETVDSDVAFHRALARATGNQYFERFIDFLGVRLVPPRKVYLAGRDEAPTATTCAASGRNTRRSTTPSKRAIPRPPPPPPAAT
jgi:GntR family transcriptional repressor for pyruvate dehydrogenase complex